MKKTLWLITADPISGALNVGTVIAVDETEANYYLDPATRTAYMGHVPDYRDSILKSQVGKFVFLNMASAFRQASKLADNIMEIAELKVARAENQKMELAKLVTRLVTEGKHKEE